MRMVLRWRRQRSSPGFEKHTLMDGEAFFACVRAPPWPAVMELCGLFLGHPWHRAACLLSRGWVGAAGDGRPLKA